MSKSIKMPEDIRENILTLRQRYSIKRITQLLRISNHTIYRIIKTGECSPGTVEHLKSMKEYINKNVTRHW